MISTMIPKMHASDKTLEESVIKVNAGKLHELLVVRVQKDHA